MTEQDATNAALAAERAAEDAEDVKQSAQLKKAQDELAAAQADDAADDAKIAALEAEVAALKGGGGGGGGSTGSLDFGVCIHSTFRTSVYADDAKTLDAAVRSDAKFYRDLLSVTSYEKAQATLFKQYEAKGLKAHLTCGTYKSLPTFPYQRMLTNVKAIGPSAIAELAGTNEPDDSDNGGPMSVWRPVIKKHQTQLYDTIKGDPATKNIPVGLGALRWANSNKWVENAAMVADCEGKFDFFNLHFYPGKGSDVLAELKQAKTKIREFTNKPIIISEGGGTTANMTEAEQARICSDLVKAGKELNIKIYIYELLDDPNPAGTDVQSNFGIYESTFADKAAVKALRAVS